MVVPIHICFVVNTYETKLKESKDLLLSYHSLTGWCDALVKSGCKITVLIRFHKKDHILQNETNYYFLPDGYGERLRPWQIPVGLYRKAAAIQADVYHGHNMDKMMQHAYLKYVIGDKKLLVQNHAETPKKRLRILLQRWLLKNIDAFLFCAKGQEIAWYEHGVISANSQSYFVMEASTHFKKKDRKASQQLTQLVGDPVFLWVGNLNENKDPLTILKAFVEILKNSPSAQLYMIYRFDDLKPQVVSFIERHEILKKQVHLLGAKSYEELEDYYNSADFFILGSHHEGSGYSLMESMACGCIPIVTDIPSFRMMTNKGQVGFLWEIGDEKALIIAIEKALSVDIKEQRLKVLQLFEQELSYDAISTKMLAYYSGLLSDSE